MISQNHFRVNLLLGSRKCRQTELSFETHYKFVFLSAKFLELILNVTYYLLLISIKICAANFNHKIMFRYKILGTLFYSSKLFHNIRFLICYLSYKIHKVKLKEFKNSVDLNIETRLQSSKQK